MLAQDASAVELDRDSIGEKSYFIQVGAFKNISNIQKVLDKLSRYEVYLEPYKDMHRIYIVNIFSPSQKKILAKVRKIYPNAFIAKGPTKAKKTILGRVSDIIKKCKFPSPVKIPDPAGETLYLSMMCASGQKLQLFVLQ